MRKELHFGSVPVHLAQLYERNSNEGLRKNRNRRNRPSDLLEADAFQRKCIRDVAKHLPLSLLSLLPSLKGNFEEITSMLSGKLPNMALPRGRGYQCYYMDSRDGTHKMLGLWKNETFVGAGSSEELFVVAMRYHPEAVSAVVKTSRVYYVPTARENKGDLQDLLKEYRALRALSPALNAATKFLQLEYVDQETTYAKFNLAADILGPVVDHYGSGSLAGHSRFGIDCGDVRCIDPLLPETMPGYCRGTYSSFPPRKGSSIVSDIAYGDGEGLANSETFQTHVDDMIKHVTKYDTVLVIKLDLSRPLNFKGVFLAKPRPHNAEVIMLYDPDGEDFNKIRKQLLPEIIAANEQRNRALITHDFKYVKKKNYADHSDIFKIARTAISFSPKTATKKFLPPNRLKSIKIFMESKALASRRTAFVEQARMKTDLDEEMWCLLPRDNIKLGAVMLAADPLVGPPAYSLQSYLKSAASYGLRVFFTKEVGWFVQGV